MIVYAAGNLLPTGFALSQALWSII